MADVLTEGLIIPSPTDAISNTGVNEIRALGNTTNTALSDVRELAALGPYEAIAANSSANDYARTGNFGIETGTIASTVTDFPVNEVGILQSYTFEALVGPITFQMFTKYGSENSTWTRITQSAGSGTFSRWRAITNGAFNGTISSGSINGYPNPNFNGTWAVPDGEAVADTPDGLPGVLMPVNVDSTRTMQVYFGFHEDGARLYTRVRDWDTHSTFQQWQQVGGNSTGSDAAANPLLIQQFTARRQGAIGTNGIGAVAFRMDHNTDDFAALLPEFVSRGLPVSLAVPADEFNTAYADHSTTTSWEMLQEWSHSHGVEIWSHSYTHGPASTDAELEHEIVDSRTFLMQQMPQTVIEGWCMIGTSGDYGGLLTGGGVTPENLYGTRAGQLVLSNYAVSNGHNGGYFRQLTGQVVQAQAHYSYESDATADTVLGLISEAAERGEGMVLMAHPDNIGATGRIPHAEFISLLDQVAQMRDAGELEVVTMGGMSLVDPASSRRPDLWVNGGFSRGLDSWDSSGWTLNGESVESSTAGATIGQGLTTSRRAALLGAPREVRVDASSVAGGTFAVRVHDSSATTTLDTSRTFTLPADGSALARLPFTIPYIDGGFPTMNLRVEVEVVSGDVSVSSVKSPAI